MHSSKNDAQEFLQQTAAQIKLWGREAGFQQVAITDTVLGEHAEHLQRWLDANYHGELEYMARHGEKRHRPEQLIPGTVRVISLRMDYLPADTAASEVLADPNKAYVSRYALGRDYHKLIRKRLGRLAEKIDDHCAALIKSEEQSGSSEQASSRAFVDSGPVLERALAEKAGLGWIGKNTMLLNREAGSWFFLGEIYTSLPLPIDPPYEGKHCGSCTACLDICPTKAFVAPFVLDARRCISYLTIESREAIPLELRPLMGNRVFGCDDCQLICPWNKFARATTEGDFSPRHQLDNSALVDLFNWSEAEFLKFTEGSPIRRIGYECWLRNLAVALGNAHRDKKGLTKDNAGSNARTIDALQQRRDHPSPLVREHVAWALQQHL